MFSSILSTPLLFIDANEYASETFSEIFNTLGGSGGIGPNIVNMVTGDGDGGTVISNIQTSLTNVASGVTNCMQAVAVAIALLFFLIALLELSTSERLTLEFFIKFFSKLVISIALIYATPALVSGITEFGGALTAEYSANLTEASSFDTVSASTAVDNALETLTDSGLDKWGLLFTTLLMGGVLRLVAWGISAIAYIICVSRLLEMSARGCFLPIAIAMMSDDGWRGAGGRYIRKYIAVCAQGAVLVVIGTMIGYVMNLAGVNVIAQLNSCVSISSFLGSLVIFIAIAIAGVSMLFKSIGIVNDAFGG